MWHMYSFQNALGQKLFMYNGQYFTWKVSVHGCTYSSALCYNISQRDLKIWTFHRSPMLIGPEEQKVVITADPLERYIKSKGWKIHSVKI